MTPNRLLLFLLFLPYCCIGQSPVSLEEFLAIRLNDYEATPLAVAPDFQAPWVDKLEIRTETRDFHLERQEYTFRLSPISNKVRYAQTALYKQWLQQPDKAREKAYQESMRQLHIDCLELFTNDQQLKLLKALDTILNDQLTLFQNELNSLQFDASKLLKLEKSRSDHQWQQEQLQLHQASILRQYHIPGRSVGFDAFPTVAALAEWFAQHQGNPTAQNTYAYELALLEKETALETAEQQQWLDFVQVRYQGPHRDLLTERIAFGMGIIIPNAGIDKIKMERLKIEKAELERKARTRIAAQNDDIRQAHSTLTVLFSSHQKLQEILEAESAQLNRLYKAVSQDTGLDPALLLDIRQRQIEQQIELLDVEIRIYQAYLNYRTAMGAYWQQPIANVWRLD